MSRGVTNFHGSARGRDLESLPESVARLTQLVARRDADLEEIAAVVAGDAELSRRLLEIANPRATGAGLFVVETIEEALLRAGLGCALLLTMSHPLTSAIVRTFRSMAGIQLVRTPPEDLTPLRGRHLRGTIGFHGRMEGTIELRMSLRAARRVAATVLGIPPKDLETPDLLTDTVGELLNIVSGDFKSSLCNAGLRCRLSPPQVEETDGCHYPKKSDACFECMAFRGPALKLFVGIVVTQWPC
jgi:CheY-specific phosphatase CheX